MSNVVPLYGPDTTNQPDPVTNPCAGCPRALPVLEYGPITLKRASMRILWRKVDINMTRAEYRLIARLVEADGEFVSYRDLYDALRGTPGFIAGQDGRGHEANMRSAIKRVRRKFIALDPTWDAIKNYTGFGYAWRQS